MATFSEQNVAKRVLVLPLIVILFATIVYTAPVDSLGAFPAGGSSTFAAAALPRLLSLVLA